MCSCEDDERRYEGLDYPLFACASVILVGGKIIQRYFVSVSFDDFELNFCVVSDVI